tara:strand:- start:261 stop:515 length:255 start_codon:yes stop_codon:yes gene_type:complete
MTQSHYVIGDTPENLNREHNVTLTEGQIATILYSLEGAINDRDENNTDQFDKDVDSIFEILEGVVDNYYSKVEAAQSKQPKPEW